MIPIKLTLRNFMPYRENVPPLNFTGIHVATISGDNGAGKSSIIDAITWALWGESRVKARKDGGTQDDIIHQGQNEAQVEFEFAVGHQQFRVLRRRARPKKAGGAGVTNLHLYIYNVGDEQPRLLDGDTITQTQRKIEEILHMDYETFTNSAYLRQGHADEFTTATPGDRKKVLANILGLEVYEGLERRARELVAQRKTVKEQLQNSLTEIDKELAELPVYEAEAAKAEAGLIALAAAMKTVETDLKERRAQKEILETKKARLEQIKQSIHNHQQQLAQTQPQIARLQANIREHAAVLARRDEIEAGYRQFAAARQQVEAMNKSLSTVNELNQKINKLDNIIEREKQAVLNEHALAKSRAGEFKKTADGLPRLREDWRQTQSRLEQINAKEENLKQHKQLAQELMAHIRGLENDRTRLEREITEINDKLHLLKNQPGAARCPMCGSDLGENGLQHIEKEYNQEKLKKTDMVKACLSEAQLKKTELKNLAEEANLLEQTITREKTKNQTMRGGLEAEITRAEEAVRSLQAETILLQEIEARLTARDYAATQQAGLQQLVAELARLNYNSSAHESARQLMEKYQPYEEAWRSLDEAEKLLQQEKESAASFEKIAAEAQKSLQANEQQRQALLPEIAAFDTVLAELMQKETELRELAEQQSRAQQAIGNIKGRVTYLEGLKEKKKERAAQWQQAAQEEQIYRELVEAFGKSGVQNLLIETAVPEIENEANQLLSKMTDGRMNVKFETQGATQKGAVTETLDIKISDELGIRSYEMFSGGEAFRINFAIRIALSRLLAHRAGAPLPTLIIDEGFGTQDTQGIEKLKEAIVAIQDDFEKILVITHIDELKDAFPARIEVTKTPDGSMINLS